MANFEIKPSLLGRIDAGLDSMGISDDEQADAVTVAGFYGEKAVVFFPQDAGSPESPESTVGFFFAGKDLPAKHYNMSRDAAVRLTKLLIDQFGLTVGHQVTVETVVG